MGMPPVTGASTMTAVRQWLEGLDLGEYTDAFVENAIDLEVLADLNDVDLEKIGVRLGHRKKLLKAITALGQSPSPPQPLPSRDAERRQITVMFCDLVGSTALSERLDPEDLRRLLGAYQSATGAVIERYDGHVAQYLGDGIVAYFGGPHAHEDDAERAVRAALEIVEVIPTVRGASPLQVRIGVASGPVVVGEGGGDGGEPNFAIGETPNLAARLQGVACTGEIVIGPTTHRLVGNIFDGTDLGEQSLKGIPRPVRAWHVSGLRHAPGRFAAFHGAHLAPLVGRDAEIEMASRQWAMAKEGNGQVLLLCGEPGIGKSRLIETLRNSVEGDATVLRYQCSPYHVNSALHPFIDQVERSAGLGRNDTLEQKLDKLESALAPCFSDVPAVAPLYAVMLARIIHAGHEI